MSPLAILLAVCCCLSAVSGQWIEKHIQMPDSFYGMTTFAPLVYSPVSQMVYVGGEAARSGASVTGIDVHTWIKQAKTSCHDFPAKGMGYNPLDDKFYVLSDVVTIAKCENNSVLAELPVPSGPFSFCHNQRYDKVYVGCTSESLVVIDGVGDSIRQTIALDGYPLSFVSNESLGKVYCLAYPGLVQVVDATADTLMAAITVPREVYSLCVSPDGLKLYCACADTLNPGLVTVDCIADTIARFVPLPRPASRLCPAPSAHKVYCGSYRDTVTVVDTDGDSVLTNISGASAQVLSYYAPRNLMYCTNSRRDSLAVIDVAADTLLTDVHVGGYPSMFLPLPEMDLMCVVTGSRLLLPLDCATNLPLDTVLVGPYTVYGLAYDQRDDKLFAACPLHDDGGLLAVIDGATRELVRWQLIDGRPVEVFYNPADNKLYCIREHALPGLVFDATAETVIATVEAPYAPYETFVSPRRDWVYFVSFYGDVIVVDGHADTTVARLALGSAVKAMAYNSVNDKLYLVLYDGALAVLDCSTNTFVTDTLTAPLEGAVCYDSRDNKVYVSSRRDGCLFVLDGQSDSVIGTVRTRSSLEDLCYNPLRNEVYCGTFRDTVVFVVDCTADTIVATIGTDVRPMRPVYNAASDKVYWLCNYGDWMSLSVIDCGSKRRVADLPLMYDNVLMEVDTVHNVTYVNWREGFVMTVVADSEYVGLAGPHAPSEALRSLPTIVRSVLLLPEAVDGERSAVSARLLDIAGRKVLDLYPGPNDVRSLAPGVYFVRAASRDLSAVSCHKVVVTK